MEHDNDNFDIPADFDRVAVEAAYQKWESLGRRVGFVGRLIFWASPGSLLAAVVCLFFPETRSSSAHVLFLLSIPLFLIGAYLRGHGNWIRSKADPFWLQLQEEADHKWELENGLRSVKDYDKPAPAIEWSAEMTQRAHWAYGAQRLFLPGDIVLEFLWIKGPLCGRGGYALQRGSKVVAEYVTWIS